MREWGPRQERDCKSKNGQPALRVMLGARVCQERVAPIIQFAPADGPCASARSST
jgi:hypothetical protein